MSTPKVHVAFSSRSTSTPCGQRFLPPERIAKFREDVTCYHCQRVTTALPSRHATTRPPLDGGAK